MKQNRWFVHSFRHAADMQQWLNDTQEQCSAAGLDLVVVSASMWPDGELLLVARTVLL